MPTNNYNLNFFVNNFSYGINIEAGVNRDELKNELCTNLPMNKNIDTKTLLMLYIQKTNEFLEYKHEVEKLIQKIEDSKI